MTSPTVSAAHAEGSGLDIRYITGELAAQDLGQFDLVTAMEVIEHVDNVPLYIKSCAGLTAPGGLLFTASINRASHDGSWAKSR